MPQRLPQTFADAYATVSEQLKQRLGDAQAAQMGPPVASDIQPAGDAERVKAWNARNPEATDQAMQQLAAQKYAEHTQAGLPQDQAIKATAEDLTHFRYGQRLPLYTYGQVGYREQIKEAERIARLAKRETTPDPEPPTPTMPSASLTNAQMVPAEAAPEPAPPLGMPPEAVPNGTMPTVPSDLSAGMQAVPPGPPGAPPGVPRAAGSPSGGFSGIPPAPPARGY
ncbi:MAG TPA: hypothetical protein VF076_07190 [Acidimicrobiales bacterium]